MEKAVCTVEFTNHVGWCRYTDKAWWALDAETYGLAGPCSSKKELLRQIAQHNRDVKMGLRKDSLISVYSKCSTGVRK